MQTWEHIKTIKVSPFLVLPEELRTLGHFSAILTWIYSLFFHHIHLDHSTMHSFNVDANSIALPSSLEERK